MKKFIQVFTLLFTLILSKAQAQSWNTAGDGLDNNVYALIADPLNNKLYAAGHFDKSGTLPLMRVAAWNGTLWEALGNGMNEDVYALILYNGELYAGGKFTTAGSQSCNYIARWNGSDWEPLSSGTDAAIYSLHIYNNELYAGGIFTNAGGNPAPGIAKWNGTAWSPAGGGISGAGAYVNSLQEYQGFLYAGGQFTDAGGVNVNSIAKWDGTSWSEVSTGISGAGNYINDLIIFRNELIATGSFDIAGSITANGIARWNGFTWSAMGSGISGAAAYGTSLGVYLNQLYAGGNFTSIDGIAANMIARYNGTSWDSLGPGCDQEVDALETFNGELYAGGAFLNGGQVGAVKIARWSLSCTLAASLQAVNISCRNVCDGSASVQVSGGISPFLFQWSDGSALDSLINICAGTYAVTVTDSIGCTVTESITVMDPSPALSFSASGPLCPGQCSGTASVSASGREPLSYLWSTSPPQTLNAAINLCAGIYMITVTDDAGCSVIDSVQITDPPQAALLFNTISPFCPGRCDGTAAVSTTSPNAPYTYYWKTNPEQYADTAINLCAGTYSVIVIDNSGCEATDSVTVSDRAPFALNISIESPVCPDNCNGKATAVSTSPYSPITYSWNTNPAQDTSTAIFLCPGTYYVTSVDSLGCISADTAVVPVSSVSVTVTHDDATCSGGGCNGSATAAGNGPSVFTYQWSTNDTTNMITSLCPGEYSVITTDTSGCVFMDTVVISLSALPSIIFTPDLPKCFGDCDGTISVNSTGSPVSYAWSTGATASSITGVCFGWYAITVTDTSGCSSTDSILVLQPDPLSLTNTTLMNVNCNGACDGAIAVSARGGTPSYDYLWSAGNPFPDIYNICAGSYTVTITDAKGCTKQSTFSISQPSPLRVRLTGTDATCAGCIDGKLTSSVTGGVSPYNYFYTPAISDPFHVAAGTYYLCVTDGNNCISCDSVLVSEPTGIFNISGNNDALNIYPNPFTHHAELKLPDDAGTSGMQLNIYNLQGKLMQQKSFAAHTKTIIIEREKLAAGIYLFELHNKEKIIVKGRFVVVEVD